MSSDPVIRERIFCALEEVRTVSGADLGELRRKLNLHDVEHQVLSSTGKHALPLRSDPVAALLAGGIRGHEAP